MAKKSNRKYLCVFDKICCCLRFCVKSDIIWYCDFNLADSRLVLPKYELWNPTVHNVRISVLQPPLKTCAGVWSVGTEGDIQKTKTGKIASKKRNVLGPPPVVSFFATPKITPIFFVGKCIYNGQNKFFAWSHVKIFLFSSIIMVQFYHELTILHGVIQ